MKTLQALTERVSSARLIEPGPSKTQLTTMFNSALRAPDHANLRPWRFITIEGNARKKLGDLFADIALQDDPDMSPSALERKRQAPFRAPTIVGLILHYKVHPKVPEVEQILSVGAAGHGILSAAYQMGVGAYWRTGDVCFDSRVAKALGLSNNEKLLGFIYLGTPEVELKPVPELNVEDFVSSWK